MTTPLFRSEVTQSKQASWMGPIHLAHNPRFSIVAGLALVLAGALLASHLAQRRSTLLAERASRLAQNRQREVHLADRIHSLSVETAQATQEHALAKRRVELAQKTSARFEQMAAEGFVSDIQAQSKQEELIDLQSRLENTLRNGLALSREQNAAEADLALLQKQLAIDLLQLERNLASLDQETAEIQSRKTSSVLAPQAGQVSTVHLSLGALAQAGQTIASLVPGATSLVSSHLSSQLSTYAPDPSAHTLVAALFAPTRTAGFIQPGQEVWLRLAAYPYQKFGLAKARSRSTEFKLSWRPSMSWHLAKLILCAPA